MESHTITIKRIQLALILVLGIGLLGFLLFVRQQTDNRSKASSNPSQEVEAGLLTGNVKPGSDTAASGGQYVVFGQTTTSGPKSCPDICSRSYGCMKTGTYTVSNGDCDVNPAFVQAPTYYASASCGPVTGGDNSACQQVNPATLTGKLGTMMSTWTVNNQRTEIIKNDKFAWMTPGNEMKMQFLDTCKKDTQGNPILDFTRGDQIVAYAQNLGMQIHGHTMSWYQQLSPCANDYTKQAYLNYIKQVATHYCGKVYSFDVVNEPLKDNGEYRTDGPWYSKFSGPAYIEASFRAARDACPSMKLYINDYSADWQNAKSDMLLSIAKDLKAKGILDGVGLQMHVDSGINTGIVATNMKRFTDAGFELAVSEMDVQLYTPTPNTEELNKQASVFGNVAAACYSNPSCKRYTVAGVDDGMSWINDAFQPDAALLFDRNYQPKPAWYSVKSALHL